MEPNQQPEPESIEMTAGAERSIWSIMIGVFTAPSQAFSDFKSRPSFLIPLIVLIVLAGLAAGLTAQYGAMVQYEMLKDSTVLPPQALEQMRQDALETNPLYSALIATIPIVIVFMLTALLALFLGKVVYGGKAEFKSVWAVTLLGGLISMVGGLLRVPLILAKESALVSFGLAAFLPGRDFSSILFSFLFYLDAFAVWSIIVTGIGYGIIFGITRGKGMAISVITSVLFIVIMIALTCVGLGFAGVDITFV